MHQFSRRLSKFGIVIVMDGIDPPRFHIGVAPKVSEKRPPQRRARRVKPKIVYWTGPMDQQLQFIPYSGPRWWTPAGYKCSPWVRFKFDQLGALGPSGMAERIKAIQTNGFRCLMPSQWSPPTCVIQAMQRDSKAQAKQMNELKILFARFKQIAATMKRFIGYWIRMRCIRNCRNLEDIVTGEAPKQPVYIVDVERRLSYGFEARTLKIAIERRFLNCDYMFAEPQKPVNPLTNELLTQGQVISVQNQLQWHRQFSWSLERYVAGGCNITRFERSFRQYLKLKAIAAHFQDDADGLESVEDFFETRAEFVDMPDARIRRFIWMLRNMRNHRLCQAWFKLTRQYYLAKEINEEAVIALIDKRVEGLLQQTYDASAPS